MIFQNKKKRKEKRTKKKKRGKNKEFKKEATISFNEYGIIWKPFQPLT
jgi:hypothetical protein